MNKFLNIYVPIILSSIYCIFIYILLKSDYEPIVFFSFVGVILSNLILMILIFSKNYNYFEAIISIFYMLFFIIAPAIQLNNGRYPVPFYIRKDYLILANICNAMFLISYIFFRYANLKKDNIKPIRFIREFEISKFTKIVMIIIFFINFIPKVPDILQRIIYRVSLDNELTQMQNLIVGKCIMFIPLFFVFYFIIQYKKTGKKRDLIIIFFWIVILIFCKNPFTEKRNALGPIYLSIILFLSIKENNTRKFLLAIFPIFVIGFPLTAVITNSQISLVDLFNNESVVFNFRNVFDQFQQLHFDAFANLNVAIDYTKVLGIHWGEQVIGSILFFIPRSIWVNKPLNSGFLIGNYLIDNYGFNYNNLSCPITAEAYLNAGLIGVIIFAFIMTKWSKLVYKWLSYRNYYSLMAWYMIIHLFFLMRGDLMNGIAYLVGPLTAIYFMPLFLEKAKNLLIRKLKYQ